MCMYVRAYMTCNVCIVLYLQITFWDNDWTTFCDFAAVSDTVGVGITILESDVIRLTRPGKKHVI